MIRPRRAYMVAMLSLAFASATAGLGLAGAPSGAGSRAAVPKKAGIPRRVQPLLLAAARRVSALQGDPHPYDIGAVSTTHGKAERLEAEQSEPPRPGAAVYLVAMRGHFVCRTCSYPQGARAPRGSVITLEILAAMMRGIGFSLGDHYPDLRQAGTPLRLG